MRRNSRYQSPHKNNSYNNNDDEDVHWTLGRQRWNPFVKLVILVSGTTNSTSTVFLGACSQNVAEDANTYGDQQGDIAHHHRCAFDSTLCGKTVLRTWEWIPCGSDLIVQCTTSPETNATIVVRCAIAIGRLVFDYLFWIELMWLCSLYGCAAHSGVCLIYENMQLASMERVAPIGRARNASYVATCFRRFVGEVVDRLEIEIVHWSLIIS